jgi:hypothetical protein
MRKKQPTLSPRRPVPRRTRIRPAHTARRRRYRFTAARRAALDAARAKRTFVMTPAKWAAVRKAAEANRRHFRLTRARLAAMRANARKMQAASVQKFQMTPARQRALRANIQKAQAAPRTPESYARSRFNHLKHGLTVRTLEETLDLLGEKPKEWEAHQRLLVRTFAPQDEVERRVVARLAEALWRRLRLYPAQARWEADTLQHYLGDLPRESNLSVDETGARADLLLGALLLDSHLYRYENEFRRKIERLLRYLLRRRAGSDPHFPTDGRISLQEWLAIEGPQLFAGSPADDLDDQEAENDAAGG